MGRFTLLIQQAIVLFVLFLNPLRAESGLTIDGETLPLLSKATRTATVFKIKIYVVAFFGKTKKVTDRPLGIEITYLRDFDKGDVDRAWDYQFKESSDYDYKTEAEDLVALKKLFGDISGDRKHLFYLKNDVTQIYENGKLKGEIKGSDFQKNFISLWFGKNPPTPEVKKELLKGVTL